MQRTTVLSAIGLPLCVVLAAACSTAEQVPLPRVVASVPFEAEFDPVELKSSRVQTVYIDEPRIRLFPASAWICEERGVVSDRPGGASLLGVHLDGKSLCYATELSDGTTYQLSGGEYTLQVSSGTGGTPQPTSAIYSRGRFVAVRRGDVSEEWYLAVRDHVVSLGR